MTGARLPCAAMAYNNPYRLSVRTIPAGRDYVWLVTGGVEHIGAVAVSYWKDAEVITELQTVPTHKEGELAQELSEMACRRLKSTVTVVAGIHIDQASRDEIVYIVEEVRRLAREELDLLDPQ